MDKLFRCDKCKELRDIKNMVYISLKGKGLKTILGGNQISLHYDICNEYIWGLVENCEDKLKPTN